MENLKKHFQMSFATGRQSGMESRSTFHTEIPSFQAEVQDCMAKLNVYLEVLGHLSGSGTHIAERFADIFKGTSYFESALQLHTLALEVNTCTLQASQNVKEQSRKLLQDLIILLETSNKNDKSDANIKVLAKCMAMLIQVQCQAFSDASSKLQTLSSKPSIRDFLSQNYPSSSSTQGAITRQSNTYNKQTVQSSQQNVPKHNVSVSNTSVTGAIENHSNYQQQCTEVRNGGQMNSASNEFKTKGKDGSLASEDELNSVIGLLSYGPRNADVPPPIMQPVRIPAVSVAVPPPPIPDRRFYSNQSLETKTLPNMYQQPWPVPLQHRSSFPLMSKQSAVGGSDVDYSMQNKIVGPQLGVPSLWSANDVNLNHSWPRQNPPRDVSWSSCHDSKDSSSDESSNGDSYFALALGADLSSDIAPVSSRRRHSSSGDETPRAEQQTDFPLNRPRSTESFQMEPKSTNTWPPKQPWARQQMANQMAEMMSCDQSVNVQMGMTPWNDAGPPKVAPPWVQGYQEATNCPQYRVPGNNNMKIQMNAQNFHTLHGMNQFVSKDK